jgi:uncharacterized lipoprotein YddW (UPF0748 family)
MTRLRKARCAICTAALAVFFAGCASLGGSGSSAGGGLAGPMPQARREFRGLWVATVSNLDWPSRRGLSPEEQRAEALAILDRAVELKLNAILLQVRPMGDALYKSSKEPWSIFLTGTMGEDPGYDPLAFWIVEAHRRGLALHAWVNPYRVGLPGVGSEDYAASSPVRARPDLAKSLGEQGYYWLDPGNPKTQGYILGVLGELASSYEIDGLVLDDYFYPYADYYDKGGDFPDEGEFAAAQRAGFRGTLADWRRANIDSFVRQLYKTVKERRPAALVGISPFGIWRPGYPCGISGMDTYGELYTDSRKWLAEGWLDYFAPQLYWPIEQSSQSFPALLEWWKGENKKGRHLWPAINLSASSATHLATPELRGREYDSEIFVARGMLPSSPGFVAFRAGSLMETRGERPNPAFQGQALVDSLEAKALAAPALLPRTPWIKSAAPATPQARYSIEGTALFVSWEPVEGALNYVVYARRKSSGGRWETSVLPADQCDATLDLVRPGKGGSDGIDALVVTSVNRLGEESGKKVLAVNGDD